MALTDEGNGMVMPVAPMYGGGYGGGMGGFGGGSDWWGILLLIALLNGGFGGWGMGGMMGGFGGMMGMGIDFPWLMAGQQNINQNTNGGFRDAMLNDNITSVRDGVSNLATQLCGCCGDIQMSIAGVNQGVASAAAGIQQSLCNGFAGTTAAINGAANSISQQLNANEVANLNRSFAEQMANQQGFNGVNSGLADVKYTIATENCADRAALSDGIRDVLAATQNQTQRILDQLCADKIDAKNDTIAQLRQELLYARGQASQDVQTARLLAGQTSEVDALYNRLKNCPVGTVPVFGNQPIFTCPTNVGMNNCGCGCGCNG